MKKILILLTLLVMVAPLFAQVDTSAYQGKAGVADVAEDDPGLLVFMLFIAIGWVFAAFLCLIAAAIAVAVILGMVAAGIVSASVLIGWYQRSIYKGVKWFVYFLFAFGGLFAGALVGLIFYRIQHYKYSLAETLSWGISVGAISGLLAGWVLVNISRIVYRKLAVRYNWGAIKA